MRSPQVFGNFFATFFATVSFAIFAFNGSATPIAFPAQSIADLVITNATILTPSMATYQAIAIRADLIIAVGSNAQIELLIGPTTIRIDAKGGTVTPGLNDAHVHFLSGSLSMGQVELLGAESFPEIETRIRAFAATHGDQT